MIDNIIWVYWLATYTLLHFGFNLSRNYTIMVAAFIHATISSMFSAISLLNYGYDFDRENLFFEIITTKFSYWYFIYDTIFLFLYNRNLIFISHHISALIVFNIFIKLSKGLSLIMLILFLGEITNPIRLSMEMTYPFNKQLYKILKKIFSIMFVIIRIPVMSYYYIYMFNNFMRFNYLAYISLNLCILTGLFGGYYWSYLLIKKMVNKSFYN